MMKNIKPEEANKRLQEDGFVILDVREQKEVEASSIDGSIHIPMMEIPNRLDELPKDKEIGVLCHHGIRSARVTTFLEQNGFDNVLNIRGGIDEWSKNADQDIPRYQKAFGKITLMNS